MQQTLQRATLDDLYKEPGKAELIDGRIVRYMSTGFLPGKIAGQIFRSLADYSDDSGRGVATTDNIGYALPHPLMSGRESFSPDVAFHTGPMPANLMKFIPAAPTFAVEVRSECDYIPGADDTMADKRADYFAAGTQVVWDVDPLNGVINVYISATKQPSHTWRRGQTADIEPIAPGWRVEVNWILR